MRKIDNWHSKKLKRILGFKKFIKIAELDKLKILAEDNPNYFYDILPYAYIFGLTDICTKKFGVLKFNAPNKDVSVTNQIRFDYMIFLP